MKTTADSGPYPTPIPARFCPQCGASSIDEIQFVDGGLLFWLMPEQKEET